MSRYFSDLRRSRLAQSHPPELDAVEAAHIRNLLAALCAERGAGEIHPRLLANQRVRRAYALGAFKPAVPDPGDVSFEPDDADDGDGTVPARRQLRHDRERVAAWWRDRGPSERVPWADGAVGRALKVVGRTLGVGRVGLEILQLVLAYQTSSGLRALGMHAQLTRREDLVAFVAAALARHPGEVRPQLAALSPLFASGLVTVVEESGPYDCTFLAADPRLVSLLLEGGLRPRKLLARFLAAEPASALALEDFDHLRPDLDALRRVLSGALERREAGHNYLFYGPSGVGKTEVARVVAAAVGAEIFAAAPADEDGDPVTPLQRLASLRVGHRMLARARAVMVFDELEDLDPSRSWDRERGAPTFGKLWMARLLEANAVPTIWIANSLAEVDRAFLRRFRFAIRFDAPGAVQRRRVWARVGRPELDDATLDELAAAYDVSFGEIAQAVGAARSAGRGRVDREVLDRILAGAVRVMGRRPAPAVRAGSEYRPDAVNASEDLVRLADRLCAWKPGAGAGVSVCLYGPSGTGKSEWAHHLARRTGRPLVVRGVSDLESKYVGETEQNISRAFEDAAQQGAILLLDEVDWLLADRRGAKNSWERSRVAEMLQQLEAFRGIAVVTTNLYRSLDQAVLRRFTFKVELRFLTAEQAALLWDAHLARFLPPAGEAERAATAAALRRLPPLTAGDFAVVARRTAQLGGATSPEALLRALDAEGLARAHEVTRPIGF